MLEVPSSPTALQYKYSFLSVSQLEGEDGPACAQLLLQFKSNLEHLVQDTTAGKSLRPGAKRKVPDHSTHLWIITYSQLLHFVVLINMYNPPS